MAENFDLIFGQSASSQYAWSDSDYQNGWQTVGSTPPTAEQFDALQRKSDTKAKDLNDRLSPLEEKAEADGRQAATTYTAGAMLTVDGLPNGWLLECIAPGISGTDAITLPDTLIDGLMIIDGGVTWALREVATNGGIGYRQPSTAYTVGDIAYHASLPTGYYLECTTGGTTGSGDLPISSPSIGGTVSDGAVTWKVCKDIGTSNAPIFAGFNQKQTFASSGSFTAPVTGNYKITLQGGGGGGGESDDTHSGGGGGSGGFYTFYEPLVAGTSYSFTIGAGGTGATAKGAKGGDGGNTSITINGNAYSAEGGAGGGIDGIANSDVTTAGHAGRVTLNGNFVAGGACGSRGGSGSSTYPVLRGGAGGGYGGGSSVWPIGTFGGGGAGAMARYNNWGSDLVGYNGGDGYITFEWLDPTL